MSEREGVSPGSATKQPATRPGERERPRTLSAEEENGIALPAVWPQDVQEEEVKRQEEEVEAEVEEAEEEETVEEETVEAEEHHLQQDPPPRTTDHGGGESQEKEAPLGGGKPGISTGRAPDKEKAKAEDVS